MDDSELEQRLGQLMRQDLSTQTVAFRDALLARCLTEVAAADDGLPLDDADLELLAAAGDITALTPSPEENPRP